MTATIKKTGNETIDAVMEELVGIVDKHIEKASSHREHKALKRLRGEVLKAGKDIVIFKD